MGSLNCITIQYKYSKLEYTSHKVKANLSKNTLEIVTKDWATKFIIENTNSKEPSITNWKTTPHSIEVDTSDMHFWNIDWWNR